MSLAIKRVLEAAGVEFIDEDGGGPGVRLRNRRQKRLTSQPQATSGPTPWEAVGQQPPRLRTCLGLSMHGSKVT